MLIGQQNLVCQAGVAVAPDPGQGQRYDCQLRPVGGEVGLAFKMEKSFQ